jgi:uncharacterized protein
MQCPICKKPVSWKGNPHRPFCSERCKLIDLDNWLSERYTIPTRSEVREKSDTPAAPLDDAKRIRD